MKSTMFLVAFLICFIQLGYSQVTHGLKGGVNIAGVNFRSTGVYEDRKAYYVGGFAKVDLNQKFFAQSELLFNVKGTKYSYVVPHPSNPPGGINYMEKGTLSFNYISLPVLIGYKPMAKLAVVLGPEFGYLTSMSSSHESSRGYYEVLKDSKKLDIGIDIGLSYALNSSLGIEARFNHGFNRLNEHHEIPNQDEPNNPYILNRPGANRVLQFGVYYKIIR